MERSTVSPEVYKFGPFELSVEAAELRKSGIRLKLQDQPFQVLCTLLAHSGEIVPRERLRQQLWPEGTFVDFEHGLNTAIKKLRDVLDDDAETPRYIETVPRKGYRFVAPLHHDGIPAAPDVFVPRRSWQSRSLFVVSIALAVGIGAILARRVSYSPDLRIAGTKQLTFTGEVAPYLSFPVIETDGRRVYYFKYADGRLYSVPVGGGAELSFATGFKQPAILHISPDGATLLVKEALGPSGGYADRIWLLPTNGDPARPMGDINAEFAAWSPDGKTIAFARDHAIFLTNDDGVTSRRLADTASNVSWIRWSPDGQQIRFTVFDPKTSVSSIFETRLDGKVHPLVTKLGLPRDACCGIWTRDGRYFLFREFRDGRTDYWVTQDRWSLSRSRSPFPLGGGGPEMVAATANPLENMLFVVGRQVSRMSSKLDLEHNQLKPFLPDLSVQNPDFSSDGKWLALCQVHTRQSVLWRARSDGSEWMPLTDPKLRVHHARFSPDAKRIALMGKWPDRPWKIYWVAAEGGALNELNTPIASQADPNWLPDGHSILFGQPPRYFAEPDSPRAIYIHDLQTNSTSKVPGSEGWFSPRISPDGHSFLALSIDEHKLAVYSFASASWRVFVESSETRYVGPSWSPDGEWAFVNTQYGKSNSLLRIRIRDGILNEVLSFRKLIPSPDCWGWGSAPDGSLLVSCHRLDANIYAMRYE